MNKNNAQMDTLLAINEELENYFSNTIIPQLFVDADLILRKFTPPAMKQFNLTYEHIGRHLDEIKENFRFPTIIANIETVIATSKILEKEVQTTDRRWCQMNILPYVKRVDKKTDGVIITFVDITPRIRDLREQERLVAEHELLLDTIAHDVKNPIFGLSLAVELLKNLPDRQAAKFPVLLENVEKSLASIKKVVNDLIDSRWKQQKWQAAEELLDLENIVEDVRLALAHQITESAAMITHNLEVSELKFVRRKLRTVIYNLVANAIKYCPVDTTPKILINSYLKDGYTVITVTDNGMGITPEVQQAIFKKFESASPDGEGSGVGLYLVKTIVNGACGKIELDSTPGRGSVFKVYLPQ